MPITSRPAHRTSAPTVLWGLPLLLVVGLLLLPGCREDDNPVGINDPVLDPGPEVDPGIVTFTLEAHDNMDAGILLPCGGCYIGGVNASEYNSTFLIRADDDGTLRFTNRYRADFYPPYVLDGDDGLVESFYNRDSSGTPHEREMVFLDGTGAVTRRVGDDGYPLIALDDGTVLVVSRAKGEDWPDRYSLRHRDREGNLLGTWAMGESSFGFWTAQLLEDGTVLTMGASLPIPEPPYDLAYTLQLIDPDEQRVDILTPAWINTLNVESVTRSNAGYMARGRNRNLEIDNELVVLRLDAGFNEIDRTTVMSDSVDFHQSMFAALPDGGLMILVTVGTYLGSGFEGPRHPMLIRLDSDLNELWRRIYLDSGDPLDWYEIDDLRANANGVTALMRQINADNRVEVTLLHTDLDGNTQ